MRLLQTRRVRLPTGTEVVSLASQPSGTLSHLDQRPDLIGERSVSLLTGMMPHNETGVPAQSRVTIISGVLRRPAAMAER